MILAALFLYTISAQIATPSGKIDTTLVRMIDVTGDQVREKVELHIKASAYDSLFTWMLIIISKDKIIYQYSESDPSLESRFQEETLEGKRYKDIKYKFFFTDFVEFVAGTDIRFGDRDLLFNKEYKGSVYVVARRYLTNQCKLDDKAAERIVEGLVVKLRSKKAVIISHTIKGFDSTLPMVFVSDVQKFIPIYSD